MEAFTESGQLGAITALMSTFRWFYNCPVVGLSQKEETVDRNVWELPRTAPRLWSSGAHNVTCGSHIALGSALRSLFSLLCA